MNEGELFKVFRTGRWSMPLSQYRTSIPCLGACRDATEGIQRGKRRSYRMCTIKASDSCRVPDPLRHKR